MQKQIYETPDLTVFGNIEALTAGQSSFSPVWNTNPSDGSRTGGTSYKCGCGDWNNYGGDWNHIGGRRPGRK